MDRHKLHLASATPHGTVGVDRCSMRAVSGSASARYEKQGPLRSHELGLGGTKARCVRGRAVDIRRFRWSRTLIIMQKKEASKIGQPFTRPCSFFHDLGQPGELAKSTASDIHVTSGVKTRSRSRPPRSFHKRSQNELVFLSRRETPADRGLSSLCEVDGEIISAGGFITTRVE